MQYEQNLKFIWTNVISLTKAALFLTFYRNGFSILAEFKIKFED